MNRDQIRQRLHDELAYRETMVSCLRRILRPDASDIDDDEVEAWAAKAEETTAALDLLVAATYEYLTTRNTHVQESAPLPPSALARAPAPQPPRRQSRDDEAPF